ncbi:hypothetical protein E1267_12640 [Nonomuraea longispora]|uniref:Uncharacterized protein n=1 Tax=Nonomuraea longispora TaxID=1848320 RepID=A0A4R4NEQ9_9ACTN|nr:hypothetical protein [Nonomuraea longispora]TDC07668.1 hypothetical protein E1267_12640 [Nonomuraea longispora]
MVLSWQDETRSTCTAERRRVLFHTCACLETSYEFLGVGGMYGFRRIRRSAPKAVAYAGPWQRGRAEKLWLLLINGQAR